MKMDTWKIISVLLVTSTLLIVLGSIQSQPSFTSDEGISLVNAFPNLSFNTPLDFQTPPDGTDRIFVVEKTGRILVFNNSPDVSQTTVFLDVSDKISTEGNEMGLLGLAFHPNFIENGYFFIDYTAANPRRTVVSQYQIDSTNPSLANHSSERIILEFEQPYTNHNGGQIAFGPDGFLYIASGDGGSGGDPLGNAQNKSNLLGALLRIDIDNTSSGRNYSIPTDNPFYGNSLGYAEEIYAFGLRNPWKFSFDSETERLWLGDVGQNNIEEIDIIENGRNYGWNIKEGTSCYAGSEFCDEPLFVDPVWEYNHTIGRSVTGGFVYRGGELETLHGKYLYGDYISGRIWALEYNGVDDVVNTELFDTDLAISSFGVSEDDSLFVVSFTGSIYTFENEQTSITTTTTSSTTTTTTTTTTTESPTVITPRPEDQTLLLVGAIGAGVLVVVVGVILASRNR
jgi:glucose/arabinose dehydrogenase